MKVNKTYSMSPEIVEKLDKILDFYKNNLGLPFNCSTALEYIINNEYIDIIRNEKATKK